MYQYYICDDITLTCMRISFQYFGSKNINKLELPGTLKLGLDRVVTWLSIFKKIQRIMQYLIKFSSKFVSFFIKNMYFRKFI